jgi:hypothetical protein
MQQVQNPNINIYTSMYVWPIMLRAAVRIKKR